MERDGRDDDIGLSEREEELFERLALEAGLLAEAVCDGDADALAEPGDRLARLLEGEPERDEAISLLGWLVLLAVDDRVKTGSRPAPPVADAAAIDGMLGRVEALLDDLGGAWGGIRVMLARGCYRLNNGDLVTGSRQVEAACARLATIPGAPAAHLRAVADAALHRAHGRLGQARASYLRAAELALEDGAHAHCLAAAAEIDVEFDDLPAAIESYAAAARIARDAGDEENALLWSVTEADLRLRSGSRAIEVHDHALACALLTRARQLYLSGGPLHAAEAATAAMHLGTALQQAGDLHRAGIELEAAHAEFEQLGHRKGVAATLFTLGNQRVLMGDVAEAETALRRAVGEAEAIGEHQVAAAALRVLAGVAFVRGDPSRAAQILDRMAPELVDVDPEHDVIRRLVARGLSADSYRAARQDLIEQGALTKAAMATAMEVLEVVKEKGYDAAAALVPELESIVERARQATSEGHLTRALGWIADLVPVQLLVARGDRQAAAEQLSRVTDRMAADGAPLLAARLAVFSATIAEQAGRPGEALGHAAPALLALSRLFPSLPDAAERRLWGNEIQETANVALRAAARVDDQVTLADLLETLRGHAMPEPVLEPRGESQSLSGLIAMITHDPAGAAGTAASTVVSAPAVIRMPWGTVTLAGHRAAALRYFDAADQPYEVDLVVTR